MFFRLFMVSTGAFLYWTLSGYKGSFNDYMSRYYDNDSKYEKNYWTGVGILTVIIIIIIGIIS